MSKINSNIYNNTINKHFNRISKRIENTLLEKKLNKISAENLYTFDELSNEAKETAKEEFKKEFLKIADSNLFTKIFLKLDKYFPNSNIQYKCDIEYSYPKGEGVLLTGYINCDDIEVLTNEKFSDVERVMIMASNNTSGYLKIEGENWKYSDDCFNIPYANDTIQVNAYSVKNYTQEQINEGEKHLLLMEEKFKNKFKSIWKELEDCRDSILFDEDFYNQQLHKALFTNEGYIEK